MNAGFLKRTLRLCEFGDRTTNARDRDSVAVLSWIAEWWNLSWRGKRKGVSLIIGQSRAVGLCRACSDRGGVGELIEG